MKLFVLRDMGCAVLRGYCRLDRLALPVLPSLARCVFGVTLLLFFWTSALTKFGDGLAGLVRPSIGAYAQILPRSFEAVGYDPSAMGVVAWAIVLAGSWAEVVLPLLIVLGFMTRPAALGMIGFILVMSVVDVLGHGVPLGSLLDGDPKSLVPDQRVFWIFPLLVMVFMGPGPLSLDRLFLRRWTCPDKGPEQRPDKKEA